MPVSVSLPSWLLISGSGIPPSGGANGATYQLPTIPGNWTGTLYNSDGGVTGISSGASLGFTVSASAPIKVLDNIRYEFVFAELWFCNITIGIPDQDVGPLWDTIEVQLPTSIVYTHWTATNFKALFATSPSSPGFGAGIPLLQVPFFITGPLGGLVSDDYFVPYLNVFTYQVDASGVNIDTTINDEPPPQKIGNYLALGVAGEQVHNSGLSQTLVRAKQITRMLAASFNPYTFSIPETILVGGIGKVAGSLGAPATSPPDPPGGNFNDQDVSPTDLGPIYYPTAPLTVNFVTAKAYIQTTPIEPFDFDGFPSPIYNDSTDVVEIDMMPFNVPSEDVVQLSGIPIGGTTDFPPGSNVAPNGCFSPIDFVFPSSGYFQISWQITNSINQTLRGVFYILVWPPTAISNRVGADYTADGALFTAIPASSVELNFGMTIGNGTIPGSQVLTTTGAGFPFSVGSPIVVTYQSWTATGIVTAVVGETMTVNFSSWTGPSGGIAFNDFAIINGPPSGISSVDIYRYQGNSSTREKVHTIGNCQSPALHVDEAQNIIVTTCDGSNNTNVIVSRDHGDTWGVL